MPTLRAPPIATAPPEVGLDLALLAVVLGSSMVVGLAARRRAAQDSFVDYAVARGRAPWWTVLASVLAAETSAATLLGLPAEGQSCGNYRMLQVMLGMVLGRLVVATYFLPQLHGHGAVSIYDFLGRRCGPLTQRCCAGLFLVTRLLATGTRVYVGAIALAVGLEMAWGSKVSPPLQLAVYAMASLALCGLTALYTSAGGMRAVLWTDSLQTLVSVASVAGCLAFLLRQEGSSALLAAPWLDWGTVPGGTAWDAVRNIVASPYTLWSGIVGTLFTTLATHGVDQDLMQRLLAAADLRRARRALILSGLCEVPFMMALLSIGILLRPFAATQAARPGNEIFALFILSELPRGLRGLALAAILTTSMGSLSAALNALATTFTYDWRRHGLHAASTLPAARRATWGMAALLAGIASATAALVLWQPTLRIIPLVMGALGLTYGPLLAIFLLALWGGRRSDQGTAWALALGLVVSWILQAVIEPAFSWRVLLGVMTTLPLAAMMPRRRSVDG